MSFGRSAYGKMIYFMEIETSLAGVLFYENLTIYVIFIKQYFYRNLFSIFIRVKFKL